MSLVAAAVCPHPPLLVPAVAGAAASELDGCRAAAAGAVGRLLAAAPDVLLIVGDGPATRAYTDESYGSLAGFGLSWPDPAPKGVPDLPLSVTIGAWLVGDRTPASCQTVAADLDPAGCAELGARLVAGRRTAMLVMGDGSACRGPQSPGYDDPRAAEFDASVAKALTEADPAALLAIDPTLAAELKCAGRAAWQVLAGAATPGDQSWRGELLYDAAPYGVAYFVAVWEPA